MRLRIGASRTVTFAMTGLVMAMAPGLAMAMALGLSLAMAGGCVGDDEQRAASQRQAMEALPLSLAPRSAWRQPNPAGPWLVTPRFGPSGGRLLAAGLLGRGLYLVTPGSGIQALDPAYRGPVHFAEDRRAICLPNAPAGERRRSLDRGRAQAGDCEPVRFEGDRGQVLFDGPSGRLLHHPMRGELQWVDPRETVDTFERDAPFSIQVSAVGPRVAYSTGSMAAPRLHLFVPGRPLTALGRGVHPVFHPDGRHLIFAVPQSIERRGDLTRITAAELRALDLVTGASWPLTDTADLAEMEPALSADARQIAFADWRGGGLWIADLAGRR